MHSRVARQDMLRRPERELGRLAPNVQKSNLAYRTHPFHAERASERSKPAEGNGQVGQAGFANGWDNPNEIAVHERIIKNV